MAVKKLDRRDWKDFFDTFSKKYLKDKQPEYAEIQILSETVGAQPETSWLILEGITYNPKDDLLDIKLEDLDRMILHPSEIYVDEDTDGWINSMEIVEQDGTKDIVEIR